MKYLITGAAGFIGYHLATKLLEDNQRVLGVDNLNDYYDPLLKKARLGNLKSFEKFTFKKIDICDKAALNTIFNNYCPQKVINLAAQPGVRYSLINPQAYLNSNLFGFLNIIELCKDYEVEGLIYASSSSIYGGNKITPFSIDHQAKKPLSLYGATKRSNELIAHAYSHIYGLHTTGLRYFTVYGPWYRPDMGIYIFVKNIIENKPITIFNNGKMSRDFTFIDDIVLGTIAAINKNFEYEIFNLGNNKSINLMKLVEIIERELNIKPRIRFQPLQDGDMVDTAANIDYSVKKLGFKPKTSIDIGIPKLIEWYRSYYNV